jgi:PKD repeat protein
LPKTALTLAAALVSLALVAPAAPAAPPTADFDVSWPDKDTTRPSVGEPVTVTANVTDWGGPVGTTGTIAWNFGEIGAPGADTATATYSYPTFGLKAVNLTVTNQAVPAETKTFTKLIVVNAEPTAAFQWDPDKGTTGQDVHFSSESDDPDGPVKDYLWRFGDGVTSTLRNPVHPFAEAGRYRVTLTATDAYGASSTVARNIDVADRPVEGPPPNKPPVANFVFGPSSPRVEDQVQFASSSYDPEGKLSEQRWDLDGDGQFDDARGDEVVWTFTSPGEHKVRLRVEDSAGAATVKERTVIVRRLPRARAGFLLPSPVVRLNGEILSKGARVRVLGVRAPRGSLVIVRCHGKGCPVERRRKRVKKGPVRFKTFERVLRAGIKLEILVEKKNTIGDYTSFKIRAGKSPVRVNACLSARTGKRIRCR